MLIPGSWKIFCVLLVLASRTSPTQAAVASSRSVATSAYTASQILRDWFEAVTEGLRRGAQNSDGPSNVAEFTHDYLTADRLASWLRDQTRIFGHLGTKAGLITMPKIRNAGDAAGDEKSMGDKKKDAIK